MCGDHTFDWDEKKRRRNREKHGLDFEDARRLFTAALLVIEDDRMDYGEARYIGLGELEDILTVVVFTLREPATIRIISFRPATPDEKEYYYGK